MKIAQIAPLYEAVPPSLYGGTERIVAHLTNALVALGHEVALFASAEAQTRATLVPVRDSEIRRHLRDVVLDAYLKDTDRAMVLDATGRYQSPPAGAESFNAQRFLLGHYTQSRAD